MQSTLILISKARGVDTRLAIFYIQIHIISVFSSKILADVFLFGGGGGGRGINFEIASIPHQIQVLSFCTTGTIDIL